MGNKNKDLVGNVTDTLKDGDVIPENTEAKDINDDVGGGDLYDPEDLEEAMKIVERKKKIKAAGKTALGVAKKAGLVVLGVAIGAIAFKGKGTKANADATSDDSVGDTDDVEDTENTTEDIVVDDVEVENET